MIQFLDEVYRKFIHLSSLWIPILYYFIDKHLMLTILIPVTMLAILIDFTRRYIPSLSKLINQILGKMMRDEEKTNFAFSGASHLLLAACITIYFFSQEVAIFSLTVLMISDSVAALIGRRYGRIKINEKSLEGSMGFALSALIIYCFLIYYAGYLLPQSLAFTAIIAGTVTELFAKKAHLNDNFAIPIMMGLCFSI